ncbi:MAG: hypothetical protein E7012_05860 [Alphaproteobacteria bacterium]|nr:hypothetical protein [Alphaproteobacteria bacterium]
MHYVFLTMLVTLAITGIIRVILLYLIKKIFKKEHCWKTANILTALLRTFASVMHFGEETPLGINFIFVFLVYIAEQLVWFIYDYIQQRRNNNPAGWGLIWGVIIGGSLWLLAIRMLVLYYSQIFTI